MISALSTSPQGPPAQTAPDRRVPGGHLQGSPTQGSPTQGSPTQGSPTQGSPTQGSPTQGSRAPNRWVEPQRDSGGRTARTAVVATVTAPLDLSATVPAGSWPLPDAVTGIEIRADLAGDLAVTSLRRRFEGTLTYSLRTVASGGYATDEPQRRWRRLVAAAREYDVVDLEAPGDLVPELLTRIPAHRRRISWHGAPLPLDALRRTFERIARVPAREYLLAPAVTRFEEALTPLYLLAQLRRSDVTAFGTGRAGVWSRLLAPWFGAPVVFGRVAAPATTGTAEATGTAGIPTVRQLLADYPFPALPPLRYAFGIVGATVDGSLSPRLHNMAYRRLGLPGIFLPFHVPTPRAFTEEFMPTVTGGALDRLGIPLLGLTVTAPHKEAALAAADTAAGAADAGGAANVLLRTDGGWHSDTTDASAVVTALHRAGVPLRGCRVAVVGCGGAGRAAASGLMRAGAVVTLVNRGEARGRLAAGLLGLPFVPLQEFFPDRYHVIVHATSLRDKPPFDVARVTSGAAVVDLVYGTTPTALTAAAAARGLPLIDGWRILSLEVDRQFHLMTRRRMPGSRGRTNTPATWPVTRSFG